MPKEIAFSYKVYQVSQMPRSSFLWFGICQNKFSISNLSHILHVQCYDHLFIDSRYGKHVSLLFCGLYTVIRNVPSDFGTSMQGEHPSL